MTTRRSPGVVRDLIIEYMNTTKRPVTVEEVYNYANKALGGDLARSSVRSYLGLNTPGTFIRVSAGVYRLRR
jgi:site-specific DNA-methyltransferase (adenine-specific)